MGRVYRMVEVKANGVKELAIAIVDTKRDILPFCTEGTTIPSCTGADETVISENLARRLKVKWYGLYSAKCASQTILTGKYADVALKELKSGKQTHLEAGVSNVPFQTDDIDEEGLDVILGVDFIQETGLEIKA